MVMIDMLIIERNLKNQDSGRKNKDLVSKIENSMLISYMIMSDSSLRKTTNKTNLRTKTK